MNKIQRAKSYLRSILSLVLLVTFISCSSNKTFKKNEKSEEKNSFLKEIHVAKNGSDKNSGTKEKPFLTIQKAADIVKAGDLVIVHKGTYRESITPKNGGESNEKRIIYKTVKGEKVIIKGSEIVKGWKKVSGDIWEKEIDDSYFENTNLFKEEMKGHWFFPQGKSYHTGVVYLNGVWMKEAQNEKELDELNKEIPLWFVKNDDTKTVVFAQFPDVNPNDATVEINTKKTLFHAQKSGVNYITINGFEFKHAATSWSAPTQPQTGMIGANWAKGWIIENNEISYSRSAGICFGRAALDTTQVMSAYGMIASFKYAENYGIWNKEKVGSHIIRNNKISNCGQAGIVGNMGTAFSTIQGNEISEINTLENYRGMEQAGIKLHGGVDVIIKDNCVYNTGRMARGIWLDWTGQGAVISNNLIFNTKAGSLYLEVNHGPIFCANNILINNKPFTNRSRGTALVHNLFSAQVLIANTTRSSPYLYPHSTKIDDYYVNSQPGDDIFYNNIFSSPKKIAMKFGASKGDSIEYNSDKLPLTMGGNLYINETKAYTIENNPQVISDDNLDLKIIKKEDGFYLEWANNPKWTENTNRQIVTTEKLGKTVISKLKFENPDGSLIKIDTDYFGNPRDENNPTPGPFEGLSSEKKLIKVWPKS
jgi:alpha-N-arabinofuranosidase|tara:strand:- start:3038 stop:4984 length:1947 start_codon:yes stop_codon:yes gene_type:complete